MRWGASLKQFKRTSPNGLERQPELPVVAVAFLWNDNGGRISSAPLYLPGIAILELDGPVQQRNEPSRSVSSTARARVRRTISRSPRSGILTARSLAVATQRKPAVRPLGRAKALRENRPEARLLPVEAPFGFRAASPRRPRWRGVRTIGENIPGLCAANAGVASPPVCRLALARPCPAAEQGRVLGDGLHRRLGFATVVGGRAESVRHKGASPSARRLLPGSLP